MKALIVDDEPIARRVLREALDDFPEVEVLGEAATGTEAMEQIGRLQPEVVFLDLQIPELNGLAVARCLRGQRLPLVVYVTAFERHALQAFETGALDYLLKPVRRERLQAALGKVRAQLDGIRQAEAPTAGRAGEAPRRIVGRLGADLHLLDPSEVIAFQADGEVVTIINTDHIRRISPLSSKRWLLRMSNGIEVTVSKRLAGTIRDETNW